MHGDWFTHCHHGEWGTDNGPNCPQCFRELERKKAEQAEIQRIIDRPENMREAVLGSWYKADRVAYEKMAQTKQVFTKDS